MQYTSKTFKYYTWNTEKIFTGHGRNTNRGIFVNFVKFQTTRKFYSEKGIGTCWFY